MRLFWIIVGILALVWMGFLHFDRKEIRLDLDRQDNRLHDVENHINNEPDGDLNIGEEIQDETNDAQEEIKQGIPTKEEQLKDEAKDKQEELKEEQLEKNQGVNPEEGLPNDKTPPPKQDIETSLPKDASGFLGEESVVAFNFLEDDSVVAFNSNYQESEIAFKQLDTPKIGGETLNSKDAYLIIDPILLSLK